MNEREKTEKGREQCAPVLTKLEQGSSSFPGWDAWKRDLKEGAPLGAACSGEGQPGGVWCWHRSCAQGGAGSSSGLVAWSQILLSI